GAVVDGFDIPLPALAAYLHYAPVFRCAVHFTSSDGDAVLPGNYTFVSGDAGVHTFTNGVTLETAGSQSVTGTDTVTSTITGTSGTITVSDASAIHFAVSSSVSSTAGNAFNVTVTALDVYDNTDIGYTGTVHFTSSDGQHVLPCDYSFVSGDAGVHTFTNGVTLKTVGSQTVTGTDTVSNSITGISGTIAVSPAAATHY